MDRPEASAELKKAQAEMTRCYNDFGRSDARVVRLEQSLVSAKTDRMTYENRLERAKEQVRVRSREHSHLCNKELGIEE